jgi:hypothetical protein
MPQVLSSFCLNNFAFTFYVCLNVNFSFFSCILSLLYGILQLNNFVATPQNSKKKNLGEKDEKFI